MRPGVFIAIVLMAGSAGASTLVVGNGQDYSTPQEAAEAVADGDTVLIRSGTYEYEGSIMLLGVNNVVMEGEEDTHLVCTSMFDNVMWIISCNGVTIRNLHATHSDPPEDQGCTGNVFGIDSSTDVTIEDCDINGCGAIGVYSFMVDNIVLRNNYIHDNTLWAVYHELQGLLQEDGSLQGLTMEGNTLVNNGGRLTEQVLSSGRETGQLMEVTNEDGYLVMAFTGAPHDRLRVCYVATGCRGPWFDLLENPEDYIGRSVEYDWRKVLTYFLPYDYGQEIMEITSIRFLD